MAGSLESSSPDSGHHPPRDGASTSRTAEASVLIGEHERLLPIANVGRIMKQILPNNAKVSKEAKETMQECASEFISFVTGEASDHCRKEKRKTVNGDDICWALAELGFDNYADPMKRYLSKYREHEEARAAACGAGVFQSVDVETMPLFGRSINIWDKGNSSSDHTTRRDHFRWSDDKGVD